MCRVRMLPHERTPQRALMRRPARFFRAPEAPEVASLLRTSSCGTLVRQGQHSVAQAARDPHAGFFQASQVGLDGVRQAALFGLEEHRQGPPDLQACRMCNPPRQTVTPNYTQTNCAPRLAMAQETSLSDIARILAGHIATGGSMRSSIRGAGREDRRQSPAARPVARDGRLRAAQLLARV